MSADIETEYKSNKLYRQQNVVSNVTPGITTLVYFAKVSLGRYRLATPAKCLADRKVENTLFLAAHAVNMDPMDRTSLKKVTDNHAHRFMRHRIMLSLRP